MRGGDGFFRHRRQPRPFRFRLALLRHVGKDPPEQDLQFHPCSKVHWTVELTSMELTSTQASKNLAQKRGLHYTLK